jgi:hypothetical protein
MVPIIGHGQRAASLAHMRRWAAGHLVAPGVEGKKEEPVRRRSPIGSIPAKVRPPRIAVDKLPQHVAGQRLSMRPTSPTPAEDFPLVLDCLFRRYRAPAD